MTKGSCELSKLLLILTVSVYTLYIVIYLYVFDYHLIIYSSVVL